MPALRDFYGSVKKEHDNQGAVNAVNCVTSIGT
jgi:hypothetical protein